MTGRNGIALVSRGKEFRGYFSRERVLSAKQQSPKASPAGRPLVCFARATLLERKIGREPEVPFTDFFGSERPAGSLRSRASGRKRGRPLRAEARTYRRSSKSQVTYRACTGNPRDILREILENIRAGALETPE